MQPDDFNPPLALFLSVRNMKHFHNVLTEEDNTQSSAFRYFLPTILTHFVKNPLRLIRSFPGFPSPPPSPSPTWVFVCGRRPPRETKFPDLNCLQPKDSSKEDGSKSRGRRRGAASHQAMKVSSNRRFTTSYFKNSSFCLSQRFSRSRE